MVGVFQGVPTPRQGAASFSNQSGRAPLVSCTQAETFRDSPLRQYRTFPRTHDHLSESSSRPSTRPG